MYDFPASPTPGQKFTPPGGPTYVFSSPSWKFDSPPVISEAPLDGQTYGRQNGLWVDATEEAPATGNIYGRLNGTWVPVSSSSVLGEFIYKTTTTPPPASGQVLFDNTTLTSAANIYISDTTATGTDTSTVMTLKMKAGAKFYVQDKGNSANYAVYQCTADSVDQGAYHSVAITYIQGAGTLSNNVHVLLDVISSTGAGGVIISDVAPTSPPPNAGTMWWESDTGCLYVYYDDGNSKQWVMVAPGAYGTPKVVGDLDMQGFSIINDKNLTATGTVQAATLKSTGAVQTATLTATGNIDQSAGRIATATGIAYTALASNVIAFKWAPNVLQMNIDSGALQSALWSTNNSVWSQANPGYFKFPNGLMIQWGYYPGNGSDVITNFPTAFPSTCVAVVFNAGGAPAQTVLYAVTIDQVTTSGYAYRPRYASGGAVAMGSIAGYWIAVGW